MGTEKSPRTNTVRSVPAAKADLVAAAKADLVAVARDVAPAVGRANVDKAALRVVAKGLPAARLAQRVRRWNSSPAQSSPTKEPHRNRCGFLRGRGPVSVSLLWGRLVCGRLKNDNPLTLCLAPALAPFPGELRESRSKSKTRSKRVLDFQRAVRHPRRGGDASDGFLSVGTVASSSWLKVGVG